MAARPPAVARVLERVTATVRANDLFTPGDLVLVWVSGGPDSVCALESLVRLRRLFRIRLAVFHLDHGLRPDSGGDAAYVRRLAARHRLEVVVAHPAEPPGRKESVELWARVERIRAADTVAERIGATRHADGHTMDDQAETILMGLVLGWGLDGLGGIAPVAGRLVRPLLDVTRAEVEAFCRSLRLSPRRDPTNADTRLLRNAIRREAIPAIERATGRSVTKTFARTADHLRRDAEALLREAEVQAGSVLTITDDGFAVNAARLRSLPAAIGSRVVRLGFVRAGLAWDADAVAAVVGLAAGAPGRRRDLPSGATARRDRTRVHVGR
ncbi:MAG TPA: tRNA lysidine(34) synthetase TilS [Actinomycetota bacterium]|nr:tRNA lysidine(34) synthetase TilS [Actinomycetota bacterium]